MTTKDEALSLDEATEGVNRLRIAIHPLAGHPQAQRRWVQMGFVKATDFLEVHANQVDAYVAAGAATPDQARLVADVLAAFLEVKAARPDLFYERECGPRAFLWSTAFEEDEWTDLRVKARLAFSALSEGKEPLIDP